MIEGKVLKVTEKLIGLEVDMNNWIVPNTGIASILISKKPKAVQVESASSDRATTIGTSFDK